MIRIGLLLLLLVGGKKVVAQTNLNVGIGTLTPDSTAILELLSTNKGMLAPRVTEAQKVAIASPATGLLVYQTNNATIAPYAGVTPTFWVYTGSLWVPLQTQQLSWSILGNASTNPTINFLGTTDAQDLVQRTNTLERLRFYSAGHVGLINTTNTAQALQFYEPSGSGTDFSSFHAGIQSTNVAYTLPTSSGTSSYHLTTNGSTTLSWNAPGSLASTTSLYWFRGTGNKSLGSIGASNVPNADHSMAIGRANLSQGHANSIVRGWDNRATGAGASVGGGMHHQTCGQYAVLVGGQINYATAPYSVISGGCYFHTTDGEYSVALAGRNVTSGAGGDYSLGWGWVCNVNNPYTVGFRSDTVDLKFGIRKNDPTEALDVNGNVRFLGALMPGNTAGSAWQVLRSNGTGTAPTWQTMSLGPNWSLTGDASTNPSTMFLGTTDAQALVFRTNNTEKMRILSGGNVGIAITAPTNLVHSVNSVTTDEFTAVLGEASGSSTDQLIGIWGDATNTNGSNDNATGVLATGNGRTNSDDQTNIALQVVNGEFTMGRTAQSPSVGTVVEPASGGTSYTAEGPSGVIQLTLGAAGNLVTSAPTNNTFQSFSSFTVNNPQTTSTSIILLNVLQTTDDGNTPDPNLSEIIVDVQSRANGSFVVRVGMIPKQTSATNYQVADTIRIGYLVVNPS